MKLKVISEWSDKGKESGIRPFNFLVFRKIYYRVETPELCSVQFQWCFKQEVARNILLSKNWQLNKTQVCVLSLYIFYPEVSFDFMVFSHVVSLFLSVAHNLWYHFFFNSLEWEHKAIGCEDTEPWSSLEERPPASTRSSAATACLKTNLLRRRRDDGNAAAWQCSCCHRCVCVPAVSPRCPWGAAVEVGGDVHCSKTNRIH